MKALLTGAHLWVGLALLTVFWATTPLLSTPTTILISNSFMLAASTAVWIAYLPACVRAIASRRPPRTQRILLGIFYSWFFGSLWRIHTLIWLRAGSPDWFIQNDLIALYQSGVTLGATYHLLSPGAIGGVIGEQLPSLKWIAVGCVAGIAILLAVVLSAYDVDTSGFVEWIHNYVPGASD